MMAEQAPSEFEKAAQDYAEGNVFREFWQFLKYNKKWWLLPIVVVLLILISVMILGTTPAAPFIYTLF
jgi:hypothetical protein